MYFLLAFACLEFSQARSENKLNFHFNTALTTVNIAKIMQLNNHIVNNTYKMKSKKEKLNGMYQTGLSNMWS